MYLMINIEDCSQCFTSTCIFLDTCTCRCVWCLYIKTRISSSQCTAIIALLYISFYLDYFANNVP